MKTINTEKALLAYNLLNNASYSKMSDGDKIKIFKITRALKPIAVSYEEAGKDAAEKMKFENFNDRIQKAQEYERNKKEGKKGPISEKEYKNTVKDLMEYDKLVKDTIKQLGSKEETIDVDLLSEDGFGSLMASNDWTMGQVMSVSDIVCE